MLARIRPVGLALALALLAVTIVALVIRGTLAPERAVEVTEPPAATDDSAVVTEDTDDEQGEADVTGPDEAGGGQEDPDTDVSEDAAEVPPTQPAPDPEDAPGEEEPEPGPILPPGPPSDQRTLEQVTTIRGDISPKSVVASHTGVFFAQNMMYRHTITVYNRDHELLATIADTVNPTDFGFDAPDADLRGAPVEMAFSPDGAYAYVSNYKMYGPGFSRGGGDTCSPADGYDDSFLYRIDVERLEIDQVITVGAVPKYVAVTPDGRYVLVSNWCSYDVSVIDAASGQEVDRIDVGRYPRGIAISADSATAYIAVMGSFDIAVLDLQQFTVDLGSLSGVGRSPRHLVLDPEERYLYATLNGEGVVARIDLSSGEVTRVATGQAPRSMDISADGLALYVVNYNSNTVSKVTTQDMQVVQSIAVNDRPIGITYDRGTAEVWVAHYSGSILVLQDR